MTELWCLSALEASDLLKKGETATEAERFLKGGGWLPEVPCRNDMAALDGAEGQGAS